RAGAGADTAGDTAPRPRPEAQRLRDERRGGRARRAGPDLRASRGDRGGERNRSARARADAGVARGGIHGTHPRRRRVQVGRDAAARGAGGMSSATAAVSIPRLQASGRVTQARVVLSEWTKFVSLRSTRWSLGVGFLLTIAFPIIFATVTATHWAHMSAQD